jgi:hypothetical protein
MIERHREWIAATVDAPYRKGQRRRARGFRAASLLFPGVVGLAVVVALLAVALSGRDVGDAAPPRDQLIPGGSSSGTVMEESASSGALPGTLRDRDAPGSLPEADD